MDSVGDFSDLDRKLGYHGDIRSFDWDDTPGAPEGGFAEVIDELVRLRAVLDGDLSASLAASSADHEETEVDDADDSDEDADDVVEEAVAAVSEVKQARLDELEQIFLRGLELIRQLKAE